MLKEFWFENQRMFYSIDGAGNPIVLLHGLCEDVSLWDSFNSRLQHKFKVLRLHLPGNGLSGYTIPLTIDFMAGAVVAMLDKEKIDSVLVAGHSMGGYVALALAGHFGARLKGLSLFHSFASADDEDKKAARNKSIEFIRHNGRADYIKQMFNNLFTGDFKMVKPEVVNALIANAIRITNDESVINTLMALRDRPDNMQFLRSTQLPVLFIAGKNDTAVPFAKLEPQMALPIHATTLVLENVGHMGMFERYDETSQALVDFANRCFA